MTQTNKMHIFTLYLCNNDLVKLAITYKWPSGNPSYANKIFVKMRFVHKGFAFCQKIPYLYYLFNQFKCLVLNGSFSQFYFWTNKLKASL